MSSDCISIGCGGVSAAGGRLLCGASHQRIACWLDEPLRIEPVSHAGWAQAQAARQFQLHNRGDRLCRDVVATRIPAQGLSRCIVTDWQSLPKISTRCIQPVNCHLRAGRPTKIARHKERNGPVIKGNGLRWKPPFQNSGLSEGLRGVERANKMNPKETLQGFACEDG